ncbi:hypothetical protein [Streptomyces sp. 1222.5]|uniref:hypothetical protein n=1 Tax=Streptomyces sp. 1222.5 TaxID=1881026 RepID=UPI003D71CB2D
MTAKVVKCMRRVQVFPHDTIRSDLAVEGISGVFDDSHTAEVPPITITFPKSSFEVAPEEEEQRYDVVFKWGNGLPQILYDLQILEVNGRRVTLGYLEPS